MPETAAQIRTLTMVALAALCISLLGNLSTAANAQQNCERIETIHSRIRANAITAAAEEIAAAKDNVANLDEEAALLGITVTPELRKRVEEESARDIAKAEAGRRATLEQFAAIDCPLFNLG